MPVLFSKLFIKSNECEGGNGAEIACLCIVYFMACKVAM